MKYRKKPVVVDAYQADHVMLIKTLEGSMCANPGDWIITGVHGERYPCKPDIFAETYEPADTAEREDSTIDPETLPVVQELRQKVQTLQKKLDEWEYWMGYRKRIVDESARQDRSAVKVMQKRCEKIIAEMRQDLAKVTAERDAAVERVKHHAGCWECDKRDKGECAMPFFKDECDEWEFRGPQKED